MKKRSSLEFKNKSFVWCKIETKKDLHLEHSTFLSQKTNIFVAQVNKTPGPNCAGKTEFLVNIFLIQKSSVFSNTKNFLPKSFFYQNFAPTAKKNFGASVST